MESSIISVSTICGMFGMNLLISWISSRAVMYVPAIVSRTIRCSRWNSSSTRTLPVRWLLMVFRLIVVNRQVLKQLSCEIREPMVSVKWLTQCIWQVSMWRMFTWLTWLQVGRHWMMSTWSYSVVVSLTQTYWVLPRVGLPVSCLTKRQKLQSIVSMPGKILWVWVFVTDASWWPNWNSCIRSTKRNIRCCIMIRISSNPTSLLWKSRRTIRSCSVLWAAVSWESGLLMVKVSLISRMRKKNITL